MKVIMIAVLCIAAALADYAFISDKQNDADPTPANVEQPPTPALSIHVDNSSKEEAESLSKNEALDKELAELEPESSTDKSSLIQSLNEQSRSISDNIGDDDFNLIAPEDESVQVFYGEVMEVSESSGLAPEAGNEMMPPGDGNPMASEPIGESKGPEGN